MNDIFKLRNTGGLALEKHHLNLETPKPNQSYFSNKTPKELRSENMECIALSFKNFRKLGW